MQHIQHTNTAKVFDTLGSLLRLLVIRVSQNCYSIKSKIWKSNETHSVLVELWLPLIVFWVEINNSEFSIDRSFSSDVQWTKPWCAFDLKLLELFFPIIDWINAICVNRSDFPVLSLGIRINYVSCRFCDHWNFRCDRSCSCNRKKLISVRTKFVHRARTSSLPSLSPSVAFSCVRTAWLMQFNRSVRRINRRFGIRFFSFLLSECRSVSNWALPTQIFTRHVMCAQLTIRNQTPKWEFSVCSIKKWK